MLHYTQNMSAEIRVTLGFVDDAAVNRVPVLLAVLDTIARGASERKSKTSLLVRSIYLPMSRADDSAVAGTRSSSSPSSSSESESESPSSPAAGAGGLEDNGFGAGIASASLSVPTKMVLARSRHLTTGGCAGVSVYDISQNQYHVVQSTTNHRIELIPHGHLYGPKKGLNGEMAFVLRMPPSHG